MDQIMVKNGLYLKGSIKEVNEALNKILSTHGDKITLEEYVKKSA